MKKVSTTAYARDNKLNRDLLFKALEEKQYIEKVDNRYILTKKGKVIEGSYMAGLSGGEFIVWPNNIKFLDIDYKQLTAKNLNKKATEKKTNSTNKLTHIEKDEIIKLIKSGKSSNVIAQQFGVSPPTIWGIKAHVTMGSYKNDTKGVYKVDKRKDSDYNFWDNIYIESINKCKPSFSWDSRQWRLTDRGAAILDSHVKCDVYNKYYAGHHSIILNSQFTKLFAKRFAKNMIISSFEHLFVNDYGAGQGIASFLLIENLIKHKIKLKSLRIHFIEPSGIALNRAKSYLTMQYNSYNFCDSFKIKCIQSKLANLSSSKIYKSKLDRDKSTLKIHLFSNILDVSSVNVSKLNKDLLNCFEGENIFVISSPNNINGPNRISSFTNFYKGKESFRNIEMAKLYNVKGKHYRFRKSKKIKIYQENYFGSQFSIKL